MGKLSNCSAPTRAAFGQLDAFESMIFMLMAGIGGFKAAWW
jgi:hypothetical protein